MKHPSHSLLVFAVSAMFAGGALAQNGRPANEPAGATSPAQSGQNAQQTGQREGQQADQQIDQQIRQFAQDPKTACDKLFLLHAAVGSMFEVQLSEQAAQKAQSEEVKRVAQKFVQDHEKMNQQLKQVAQQLGVEVPQSLPQMKQEELQISASLSGREYDQHFVACMIADHAHDVAAFNGTASLSQNAQVKQFASENLPTLEQHYQMVRQLAPTLGISTQGTEATPASAHLRGTVGGEGTAPAGTNGSGVSNPANNAAGNTSAQRPANEK